MSELSVLLTAYRHEHKDNGKRTCTKQHGKRGVPADIFCNKAYKIVGQYGRTEEIAKEASETSRSASGILRCEVESLHTDKHHRSINEEADTYHAGDNKGEVRGCHVKGVPIKTDKDGHKKHKDYGRHGALAMKELVVRDVTSSGTLYFSAVSII